MSINKVNGLTNGVPKPVNTNANVTNKNTQNAATAAVNNNQSNPAAVYERSNTNSNWRPDTTTLNEIRNAVNSSTDRLRELVTRLLQQQGQSFNNAFNINMIEIDDATRLEAQSLVADDGFWGVEQTAQRIFDFAYALAGGDPERGELLRGAVERGFANAERIWGGELPEISGRTFNRVTELFDNWMSPTSVSV
ncbi:MAG: hypothetical protein FWE24_11520 [Defluviitaleaceae bacterium]|nr:hypothetical protein [Defluviitaleaceae bacterium]